MHGKTWKDDVKPAGAGAMSGLWRGLARVGMFAAVLAIGTAVMTDGSVSRAAVIRAESDSPKAVATPRHEAMFVEADYRLPDGIDVGESEPYGAAGQGSYGLFSVENALVSRADAWHLGFQYRYERYRYLDGKNGQIKGSQTLYPISLIRQTGNWAFGMTVPFQQWEATADAGNKPYAKLSGLHDVDVRATRQVWVKDDGSQGVTAHLAGRIPGGKYDIPYRDFTGKTRNGVKVGPAWASRGGWLEAGGAYSRKIDESWLSHLNLAYAYDAQDAMSRLTYGGSLDYRLGQNMALTGQVNGTYWAVSDGLDGGMCDLLLGAVLFNDRWQVSFGVPIGLQHDWGFGHDIGFTGGVSTTW